MMVNKSGQHKIGRMKSRRSTIYQIRLRGMLDAERAAWFSDLSIERQDEGNTLLVGALPDQSAMLGVLLRAHNLNLHILSMNTLDASYFAEEK